MNISGEWVAALALNAVRHRMGSRHAIETVIARWLPHREGSGLHREAGAPVGRASSAAIPANTPFKGAASMAA